MGVQGLWKLIEETRENTLLTSLASKIVAIDSSIWIYQFLKSRPDAPLAPLVGFLSRIIKLEMNSVKCIFVFDGVAPTLKKRVLTERKRKRGQGKELEAETEMQVFQKRLQLHVLENKGIQSLQQETSLQQDIIVPPEQTFYIPTSDPRFATEAELKEFVESHGENAKNVNLILKHAQILDQKLQSRRPLNHGNLYEIAQNPLEFSKFQIENLKKRNEMTFKYTEFTQNANLVKNPNSLIQVEAGKVCGERNMAFVLVKKDGPGYEMRFEVFVYFMQDKSDLNKEAISSSKSSDLKKEAILSSKSSDLNKEAIFSNEQDILDHLFVTSYYREMQKDGNQSRQEIHEEPEESVEEIMRKFDALEQAKVIRESKKNHSLGIEPRLVEQCLNEPEKSIEHVMFEFACMQPCSSKLSFAPNVQLVPPAHVQKSRQLLLEFWISQSGERKEIEFAFDCEIHELKERFYRFIKRVDKMPDTVERMGDLSVTLFWRGCFASILAFREGNDTIFNPTDNEEFIDYETEEEDMEAFCDMIRAKKGFSNNGINPLSFGDLCMDDSTTNVNTTEIKALNGSHDDFEKDYEIEFGSNHYTFVEDEVISVSSDILPNDDPRVVCIDLSPVNEKDHTNSIDLSSVNEKDHPNSIDLSSVNEKDRTNGIDLPLHSTNGIDLPLKPYVGITRIDAEALSKTEKGKGLVENESVEINSSDSDHSVVYDDELSDYERNNKKDSSDSDEITLFLQQYSSSQTSISQIESDIDKLKNQSRDSAGVTNDMISDCQELLRLFGIPFITAAGEAEAQCAWMQNNGIADVIITDDSDVLLFGDSCRVYRNVFNKNKYIEYYSSESIFASLKFTREKFVQLAMLIGSDYSEGIKGIGAITGVEILERFEGPGVSGLLRFKEFWQSFRQESFKPAPRGFSKMKKLCKRIEIPESFPDQRIYDAYFKPHINNNVSRTEFSWEGPNFGSIRKYLNNKLEWDDEKCNNILGPLEREMQKRNERGSASWQSTLDTFVLKTVKSPSNQRVANVIEKWKVKQVRESDVKIDMKHIKIPKTRKNKKK